MKRVEKSIVNMRYGLLFQFTQMILRFLMRTVMVKAMGDAFVGLNSLFVEVIAVLSLAEMGVGSAITYSLYKPLAERDNAHVARLMCLYRRAYEVIAAVVLGLGLIALPWVHLLVKQTDFDLTYIRVVYLFFLVSTASTYLFSYKSSLLAADQRGYKMSQVDLCVNLSSLLLQIAIIYFFKNFLLYLAVRVVGNIVRNLFVNAVANKQYPFLRERAELPPVEERKDTYKRIKHTFVGMMAGKLNHSTDNILISLFSGTIMVGLCANYTLITSNIRMFLSQISISASGGIGNMLVEETPERCAKIMNRLTFVIFLPTAVVASCLFSQASPFIGWWLGESRILSEPLMLLCVLNFLPATLSEPLWKTVSAAGLFAKDKNISILGMIVNIAVSLVLGFQIGALGVLIGTLATQTLQIVLKLRLIYRETFKLSVRRCALMWLSWLIVWAVASWLGRYLGAQVALPSQLLTIILRAVIAAATSAALLIAVFWRTDEMRYILRFIKSKARA